MSNTHRSLAQMVVPLYIRLSHGSPEDYVLDSVGTNLTDFIDNLCYCKGLDESRFQIVNELFVKYPILEWVAFHFVEKNDAPSFTELRWERGHEGIERSRRHTVFGEAYFDLIRSEYCNILKIYEDSLDLEITYENEITFENQVPGELAMSIFKILADAKILQSRKLDKESI